MASSPLHNIVNRSSSESFHNNNNNNGGYTPSKERANTYPDSENLLSPSYSKDEDYDSIADSQLEVEEFHHDNKYEEDDLMGSGMLILEALAPGESSSPIRGSSSGIANTTTATTGKNNKVIVAGRKYDLCGSMYKRRGGFGRNKENNW